jgi:putative heme-binding domain-containing protein
MKPFISPAITLILFLSLPILHGAADQKSVHRARSVSAPEKDNSPAAELASFELAAGYEANLFADENDGVANPVCMTWDPAGRLWVLTTMAYPQLIPTDEPNDKLIILEDTDGDGRADKTIVFADGLNMPMGFALGHGGAYVAQGTDLLHLKDTDGDEQADTHRVLLTGFGTGDTHQNINSLSWTPGGELLFCQGLHTFSRVETPWGVRRLDEHGAWRLRPLRLQLHAFSRTGGANPWGINFGNWGEPFSKGNGSGVYDLLPALVTSEPEASRYGNGVSIGRTEIKSMIIEIADSPHLPDDIQGDMLIAGYFAHLIDRFDLETDGAGHRLESVPPLLTASHRAFRPVDIRVGPDGAIYIADWFNPIIGHYQASFRHPDRDKTHGRVWRITAKGRPLAKAPALSTMNAKELCVQLQSKWRYVRLQAKRRLADLPRERVIPAVNQWIDRLSEDDPNLTHHLYEAIGVFESHEAVNTSLLKRLLAADDDRARAYATRVVGRWHDRLDAPLDLLRKSATDVHARVRLEAIVASSEIRDPKAIAVAALAASPTPDKFTQHAFQRTVHARSDHWLPALQAGKLQFDNPENLTQVLRVYGGKDVAVQVRQLIKTTGISAAGRSQLLELLAAVGTTADLKLVFEYAMRDSKLLEALVRIAEAALPQPPRVGDDLATLLASKDPAIQAAAARLAGIWRQRRLVTSIEALVNSNHSADAVRAAAIASFGELAPQRSREMRPFITDRNSRPVRLAALRAVWRNNADWGMADGLKLVSDLNATEDVADTLAILMARKTSAETMVNALRKNPIGSDDAKRIIRWLNETGVSAPELMTALFAAMDVQPGEPVKYSQAYVDQLTMEARRSGDPVAGRKVFQSPLIGCAACHQVAGLNQLGPQAAGPELTAVGAGLQVELIIEAILWPKRQIKEGYEAASLMLKNGNMISGYLTEQTATKISIRDMATHQVITVPRPRIEKIVKQGTIMPEGLTALLTRRELRDMVAYLSGLKGTAAQGTKGSSASN